LGVKDKLFALYGLVKLMLADRRQSQLEDQSFYRWLKDHHQTERTIETFWNLITLPTLNDNVRDVSASMGMMVFQEGILKGRGSANIGYAKVGLSELIGDAARSYIQEKGGSLLLGRSVSRIVCSGSQVTGVELVGGEVVRGDVYISALPYNVMVKTLPKEVLACEPLRGISGLSSSPIVNVHIWYDRQIMDEEFVAVLDSPLQWVFNKSRILGLSDSVPGQYLCISLSGAWDYIHQPKEDLQRLFVAAMAEAFPKAVQARAEKVLVVKEAHATFRCLPGAATHRPSDIMPLDNLYLAGEWTDTGWPSTMEGAVRSGQRAAETIIDGK
jgi:squalene-associated FAD-dependent desaturase